MTATPPSSDGPPEGGDDFAASPDTDPGRELGTSPDGQPAPDEWSDSETTNPELELAALHADSFDPDAPGARDTLTAEASAAFNSDEPTPPDAEQPEVDEDTNPAIALPRVEPAEG